MTKVLYVWLSYESNNAILPEFAIFSPKARQDKETMCPFCESYSNIMVL